MKASHKEMMVNMKVQTDVFVSWMAAWLEGTKNCREAMEA
jgi:hypothetical protein